MTAGLIRRYSECMTPSQPCRKSDQSHRGSGFGWKTPTSWRPIAAATIAGLLLVGCSTATSSQSLTINALWFGKQSDGALDSGITKVVIDTKVSGDSKSYNVNLDGLKESKTGEVWNAAAWSAATVGTLTAGINPQSLNVSFATKDQIDGPSAGALMTTGVLADLRGSDLISTTTMTGTILPNGSIGAVGGVPEKIRAAKQAGITRVLIPAGRTNISDPRTGQIVDVIQQGKQLGVEVIPVASVTEAYKIMAGKPQPTATADPGPISPALLALLRQETQSSLDRMSAANFTIAPAALPEFQRARVALIAAVTFAKTQTPLLLSQDKVFDAFSRATLTERIVGIWNAKNAVITQANKVGVAAATAELLSRGAAQRERTNAALAAGAATSLSYVEQYTALPDALSWATDALATIDATQQNLAKPGYATLKSLGDAAGNLASVDYDAFTYLPISIKAVQATGRKQVSDPARALTTLSSYASFLAEASKANTNYYNATHKTVPATDVSEDAQRNSALARRWDELSGTGTDQSAALTRLSSAISYFIVSTQLVADEGVVSALGSNAGALSELQILDENTFSAQSKAANDGNYEQEQILAAQGLDSSYLRWGNDWGNAMAQASTVAAGGGPVTDDTRREGLAYQWYANIQGKMIPVVANAS